MKNFKKVGIISFLVIIICAFIISGVFAQEKELEVEYPQIPGTEAPETTGTSLPQYVKYIFNFSIWIAGFIALIALVVGGVKYLTSAGNPSQTADAKDQMFAGILGLIVILSSWLILSEVNPQLLTLQVTLEEVGPPGEGVGVYLCDGAGEEANCASFITNSNSIPSEIKDNVSYIRFVHPPGTKFGAVLHSDEDRQGSCSIALFKDSFIEGNVSSITVFKLGDNSSGRGVTLYECKDYSTEGKNCDSWPIGTYALETTVDTGGNDLKNGKSIEIDEDGNYIAILYQNENLSGRCEVFTQDDPDLASNYIGICGFWSNLGCFGAVTVLPVE